MNDVLENPPAYPHHDCGDCGFRPGMTLRDYFAAAALQGIISGIGNRDVGNYDEFLIMAAKSSYEYADSMLEARKS